MPDRIKKEVQRRAFWFGTITFGLVSVPVALFPANRQSRSALRMLGPDGTMLRRRYYCPREDRPVDEEEIVRGYEVQEGKYVTVSDEELEALEPEKSKEINLSRFVPIGQIDPIYVDRTYFLAPTGDSPKAYQLLAETMERTKRAGIATFVLRGREYLTAIVPENGILGAHTLRFAEEIRDPEEMRLSHPVEVPESKVEAMAKEIEGAAKNALNESEMTDPYVDRLMELISKKKASGRDVLQVEPEDENQEERGGQVIDLMEVLKRSMGQAGPHNRGSGQRRQETAQDLQKNSKDALYERAKELGISGRSSMNKKGLIQAILREKSA
mgnify:CR=1 FL=1